MSGPSNTKVRVSDNFNGLYTLSVPQLATLGHYTLSITRGGTPISGSPYNVQIFPGTALSPTPFLLRHLRSISYALFTTSSPLSPTPL